MSTILILQINLILIKKKVVLLKSNAKLRRILSPLIVGTTKTQIRAVINLVLDTMQLDFIGLKLFDIES